MLAAAAGTAGARARSTFDPRVTIIGDSIATGMLWHPDAVSVMQVGLAVDWQVAVCRRLTTTSCPFLGGEAPNALDVIHSLGSKLGPTVVVEMGYNELEATFEQSVRTTLQALLHVGVQRVLWLTLHETRHPYVRMNATLVALAARYPQLTLVDWNLYSRSHPEWFQSDGEHLDESGGVAMATLVHRAVMHALDPLVVAPTPLPVARVGRRYAARLQAVGGTAPVRWALVGGRPPYGLHLRPDGGIYGVPTRAARVGMVVRATDADGQTASRRETVTVTP